MGADRLAAPDHCYLVRQSRLATFDGRTSRFGERRKAKAIW
jgi:hypothetical protein